MKKCLVMCFLFFPVLVMGQGILRSSSLIGGLNYAKVMRCRALVKKHCAREKIPLKNFDCLIQRMERQTLCKKNLVFYKLTSGFIEKMKHYKMVDVIYTTVVAADHTDSYFLLDRQGEVISPIANIDITKGQGYSAIRRLYPEVMLSPVVVGFPKMMIARNGDLKLVFQQWLTDGCLACEKIGVAVIAYYFSSKGRFKGRKLIRLVANN